MSEDPRPTEDAPAPENDDLAALPPVTPPSAGFIVQLFLVPAVIVMAIVGVWALFGRLAATQHDWSQLVKELASNNKHRRDRAMLSLAQTIEADRALGEEGQDLAGDEKVARALVDVFEQRLAGVPEFDELRAPKGPQGDEFRRKQEETRESERLKSLTMTARALGLLDQPAIVAPALMTGMAPEHPLEVRKDCINSISVIANRAAETDDTEMLNTLVETPNLVDELVALTQDDQAAYERPDLIRDTAVYALGLLPSETAVDRLEVLAEHRSPETRFNAAVALARQDSTAGLPVFEKILGEADASPQSQTPPARTNLLLITLLAATFTALIMAAANKGAIRYIGTGLSVVLLAAAGMVVANDAQKRGETTTAANAEEREAEVDRVLVLHTVQNSLKATELLADAMTTEERDRFSALVRNIAETHPEPRLRIDASRTLKALEAAGTAPESPETANSTANG